MKGVKPSISQQVSWTALHAVGRSGESKRLMVTKNLALKRVTDSRLGQGLCQTAHLTRPTVGSGPGQTVFPEKLDARDSETLVASSGHGVLVACGLEAPRVAGRGARRWV